MGRQRTTGRERGDGGGRRGDGGGRRGTEGMGMEKEDREER